MELCFVSQTCLERPTKEGDSPVDENKTNPRVSLSRVGHVKSGLNLGGPPSKAK